MKLFAEPILLILFVLIIIPFCSHAQEENATIISEGNRYISFKIKAIDKYNNHIERQQKQLLNKLKRKEKHFEHKLKSSDSLVYAKYKEQKTPSYDSISKFSQSDTGSTAASFSKNRNATIDSLKGIQSFVQSKSGLPVNAPQTGSTTSELNSEQGKLNFRNYVTQLITQRMNSLKSLAASNSNVPGITGIEKQVYYGKAKMGVYKQIEEDPTKLEDKAMEYLQGTKGFGAAMNNATQNGMSGMGGLTSGGDMGKMGFQTKGLLQTSLQQKFGGSIGGVAKQFGDGMQQFQDKQNELNQLKDAKQSAQQLKSSDKPDFKVNPMRGLPFWKRIQKQYNWQTTRPVSGSNTPALIDFSAMAGYKQSPKLTYGLGVVSSFGLGQSWQDIHFTFQGVGLRTYATWAWQYGIGFYAGYERMYKQAEFTCNTQSVSAETTQSPHNSVNYSESVLVGLTKNYRISDKWDGQIQLLYDVWWQEKGLASPIVLRFATIQK